MLWLFFLVPFLPIRFVCTLHSTVFIPEPHHHRHQPRIVQLVVAAPHRMPAMCRPSATTICRTGAAYPLCRRRTTAELAADRTPTARATAMWTMSRPCRCTSGCRRRRAAAAAGTSRRRRRTASTRSRIARDARNVGSRTTKSATTQVRTGATLR